MVDISELTKRHVFSFETESLGTVRCGFLAVGMLPSIENVLKAKELDAVSFARQLLTRIGHRVTVLDGDEAGNGTDQTDHSMLSEEDTHYISDDEIEVFSREFVAHNDWLLTSFEDTQRSDTKNSDGESIASVQTAPDNLLKDESERDSDYLIRIVRHYLDEQAERINRMFGSNSTPLIRSALSRPTNDLLKKHFSLSDQLGTALRGLSNGPTEPHVGGIAELERPDLTLPENPIRETNRHLGDVVGHAEELRAIVFQCAELFRSMSDSALHMHADFNKSAKRSTAVSLLVASIAVASLFVTAMYSWWSYGESSTQEVFNQRTLQEQQSHIETLIEQQDRRYEQMLDRHQKQLETLLDRQDERIERIAEDLVTAAADQSQRNRRQLAEMLLNLLRLDQGEQPE